MRSVKRDFHELKAVILNRDHRAIWKTDLASYENLNPAQRNEVALLLAKAGAWDDLRYMAVRQLISEPAVIPYLIEALESREWPVRQTAYSSLVMLTERRTGEQWLSGATSDVSARQEAVGWWKKWWQTNKDKRPIVDAELAEQAAERVRWVIRVVEKEVKLRHAELSGWPHADDEISKPVPPPRPTVFFKCEYDPRRLALPPRNVNKEALPWILVLSGFSTPEGPGVRKRGTYDAAPTKELQPLVKTVYREQVARSDVEVKVLVASPNENLVRDIADTLRKAGAQSGDKRAGAPAGP